MSATRIVDPHPAAAEILASIPLIESHTCARGTILHVTRDAFMDAPSVPALVMHAVDYQTLQVSAETGRPMGDVGVQLEGIRRYVVKRAEERAARAVRRIERMHKSEGRES